MEARGKKKANYWNLRHLLARGCRILPFVFVSRGRGRFDDKLFPVSSSPEPANPIPTHPGAMLSMVYLPPVSHYCDYSRGRPVIALSSLSSLSSHTRTRQNLALPSPFE